ncbi:hypothetical protein ACKVMT_10915 [Halobacteriales archaeon Cl-PHB]
MRTLLTRKRIGAGLVVLAVCLFTLPALFPVQTVLMHDTTAVTFDGQEQIEAEGVEIVSYGNLSTYGQELYVNALENDGKYSVPPGEGAEDFEYLTGSERRAAFGETNHRPASIAIDRANVRDIPVADEPFAHEVGTGLDEHGQKVQRYDMMQTTVERPSLSEPRQLVRLVGLLLAVLSLGIGGYQLSSKL